MSILEAQVTFLPRAITQVILAQNQSPGPVWNAKTYTNLPVLIEKAPTDFKRPQEQIEQNGPVYRFPTVCYIRVRYYLYSWF